MSQEISTLVDGKVIFSVANAGTYKLSEGDKEREYFYEEYCEILKNLWEDYVLKGQVPRLLNLPLSNKGLIVETIHCLAPTTWEFPKATRLLEPRE